MKTFISSSPYSHLNLCVVCSYTSVIYLALKFYAQTEMCIKCFFFVYHLHKFWQREQCANKFYIFEDGTKNKKKNEKRLIVYLVICLRLRELQRIDRRRGRERNTRMNVQMVLWFSHRLKVKEPRDITIRLTSFKMTLFLDQNGLSQLKRSGHHLRLQATLLLLLLFIACDCE